jgi:hypothetical protein
VDGISEGARDLIVAVFRVAVADYLALAYGHDEPSRPRPVRPRYRADAELFLRGPWAACLGDWINLSSSAVLAQAQAARSDAARVPSASCLRVA